MAAEFTDECIPFAEDEGAEFAEEVEAAAREGAIEDVVDELYAARDAGEGDGVTGAGAACASGVAGTAGAAGAFGAAGTAGAASASGAAGAAPRIHLFDEIPRIEGARVVLRPLDARDAAALAELASNPNVYRYEPTFLFERQFTDARNAIAQVYGDLFADKKSLILGVALKDEGEALCGLAEFYGLRQNAHKASIGYRLAERYWGRGIASETVGLMLGYLSGRTDIHLVTASTLPGNAASARVLEKNGFSCIARGVPEDWGLAEPLPTDKWLR